MIGFDERNVSMWLALPLANAESICLSRVAKDVG
jgi:hypothetical protein